MSGDETSVAISWSLPSDTGGLTITGYLLEVKTNTGTFVTDLTNCNAGSDTTIINARTCTFPVDTLRADPFLLGDSESIFARVTAINDIGSSTVSSSGITVMPIAPVKPDPPTTLVRDEGLTTKTQVSFTWSAPANDGGSIVIDYAIEMDNTNDGIYT